MNLYILAALFNDIANSFRLAFINQPSIRITSLLLTYHSHESYFNHELNIKVEKIGNWYFHFN